MSANPNRSNNASNDAQLGVALDGTLLTATWRVAITGRAPSSASWRTLVVPCDGTASSIEIALAEVAAQAPRCRDVAFTLQRPLASARQVRFPKMRRAEVERVLERDWSRYVIGLRREHHITTVMAAAGDGWHAAFAPVATLEALESAARAHGWEVRDVRTTDDALAAAAMHAMPTVARIDDAIAVVCGAVSAADVVHLRRGVPFSGRQLIDGGAGEIAAFARRALGDTRARSATLIVVGDAERGATLARELGREGLHAQHATLVDVPTESPAALFAAAALLHPARLPLVAPTEMARRSTRARTATRWLVAATIALVAAGFAIEDHRVSAALEEVARQRAAIAPKVSDAVARRARLDAATDAASTLAAHEARASHASAAVAAITLLVPSDASLSMLQLSGDSVNVEGESGRSADVYAALRTSPTLEAVRLAGPLRQERQADDATVEHFAFVARLRRGAP